MFDIVEGESICYQYFIDKQIKNREELRKSLKTNPIVGIKQSFVETMFSNFKKERKVKDKDRVINNKHCYKIICINDMHIPFHDPITVDLVFEFIKQEQPDELILNGDIIDCYWESKFLKNPGHEEYLQDEANKFYKLFSGLRKWIPNTTISYILGNHEDRIERETWATLAFYGVEALQIPNLLKCKQLGIDVYQVSKVINDFEFFHGDSTCKHSSYSAKSEFENHCAEPGMSGHTHRMGCYHRTGRKRTSSWYENGCLCTMDPNYIKGTPNWQQGFSIIHQIEGITHVTPILILDHQFLYNGVLYK